MKKDLKRKVLSLALAVAMTATLTVIPGAAEPAGSGSTELSSTYSSDLNDYGVTYQNIDASTYLDYSAGIAAGVYKWFLSADGSYYELAAANSDGTKKTYEAVSRGKTVTYDQGVYTSANLTNGEYQQMLVYVPAAYLNVDKNGSATFNENVKINGYTADTAPVVYENICYGWFSSSPAFQYEGAYNPIDYGMIFVVAGARSRGASTTNTSGESVISGKMPTPVVDLKAGVIEVRANQDIIPGNSDRIFSLGMSGGGQMSSILGASGNMKEYYPYMYESGVLGVTYDSATNTYASQYDDSVYGCETYSAIADMENADLAYAWLWYETAGQGGECYTGMGSDTPTQLSAFQLALQKDEAYAFAEYVNSMNLKDLSGNPISFDVKNSDGTLNLRAGSYYQSVLKNISNALNEYIAAGNTDPYASTDISAWAVKNSDGTYTVTSLTGYMVATMVSTRNKDVPGFDTFDLSAENNAFGAPDQPEGVHYAASVAQVLKDHYSTYAALDGFNKSQVDLYIEEALDGSEASFIDNQTNMMNATEILLGSDGLTAVTPAKYWRVRSGAVDQHTSFTISYDLALAAGMNKNVSAVDYGQMWGLGHDSTEVRSLGTGTFVDWVDGLCKTAMPFTDVNTGNWFYNYVAYAYDYGLMNGMSEQTFDPESTATRAQVVTVLYRAAGSPAVSGTSAFTDLSADWYKNAVEWASEAGITLGTSATTFDPDATASREQLACFLYRFAAYRGSTIVDGADLSGYSDAAQISSYAVTAMKWGNAAGIITGESATTLNPQGTVTRAVLATMLGRFVQNVA